VAASCGRTRRRRGPGSAFLKSGCGPLASPESWVGDAQPNPSLHLTAARISVLRGMRSLQRAAAGELIVRPRGDPLVSKFGCTCGHSIIDQTDYLPYKGQVLKDQDNEAFFASTADALVEFMAGVRSGDLAEWHRKWPFLSGKTDVKVAWSLLGWFWRKFAIDVYECEQCGRLWVQEGTESERFVPFIPEDASAARILPSEHFRAASSAATNPAEQNAAADGGS
jgi:hypothetical protein